MVVALLLLRIAAGAPAPAVSAPISNLQYDITFTRETAAKQSLAVQLKFDVTGSGDVLLSLPSWTPGAYEVTNFARWVADFTPTAGETNLRWDKIDYDTWRIRPAGAKQITVTFDFLADSLDNAMAWSQKDFAFFNGTNLLLYPEGRSLDFPATVRVHTESDWLVATGMHGASTASGLSERNYHDLVDMPFFVGKFDLDSTMVGSLKVRLATYPAGKLTGEARAAFWEQYKKLFAPEAAVFGETPYDSYTTLMVLSDSYGGGSALEHQNSHLGIYTTQGIGQLWMASVTAHEMFHAFNVKRLRPAEMVPYRYDVATPTVWLWVSEGITDYYADLTLVRGGVVDSAAFLEATMGKISTVTRCSADRPRGCLAFHLDPSDGRLRLHLLPQGLARRVHARHPDPRRERQPPLPRHRDARRVPDHLQARQGFWHDGVVGGGEPGRGGKEVRRLLRPLHRRPRAVPLGQRAAARRAPTHDR